MKQSTRIFFTLVLSAFFLQGTAQKPAYLLYNEHGNDTSYESMVEACAEADVILFGELHNNPISHWLQLQLTNDIHAIIGGDLVLGAEMFERDGQLLIDEYFSGFITQAKFEEDSRLWKNYKTDYKPLLEFAHENNLKFIGTNIPRRYANSVYNLGLDTLKFLTKEAKKYLMPLPLSYDTTLNCYTSLAGGGPMGHGSPNLRDAQAVKDATMTHFIMENLKKDETFIHYNGAYHSDNFESMYYFLKMADKKLNIVTISTVSQKNIDVLSEDNLNKAHFIICVPDDMTTTY
ncbi:ChaN family lipoprotein [Bacteroidota bacterium]